MKTIRRLIATLVLVALLVSLTGCYGSFALTKKVYQWNGSLGDKWLNTGVMYVFMFLPVYEAAAFIDVAILNAMEFWTGNNPLAMAPGDSKVKFVTNDGKTYKIEMQQNSINISETAGPDKGKAIRLNYSPTEGNWTMTDGKNTSLVATTTGSNLNLIYPDGTIKAEKLTR